MIRWLIGALLILATWGWGTTPDTTMAQTSTRTPTPTRTPRPTEPATVTPTMITVPTSAPLPPGETLCLDELSMDSPVFSPDGRYIAFHTFADNVVAGDRNEKPDVVRYDRITASVALVSVASDGSQGDESSRYPAMSDDGQIIAFASGATNFADWDDFYVYGVYVHNMITGETTLVSQAELGASFPTISADGRYVAYYSLDGAMESDANGYSDVVLYDQDTSETSIISWAPNGTPSNKQVEGHFPVISADGSVVVFSSAATNLFDDGRIAGTVVYDVAIGMLSRLAYALNGEPVYSREVAVSEDGRYVAVVSFVPLVAEDTNNNADVYVIDRVTGTSVLASIGPNGAIGNDHSGHHEYPYDYDAWYFGLSGDGQIVAFYSAARNFWEEGLSYAQEIFVRDLVAGQTTAVTGPPTWQSHSDSNELTLSRDGSALLFVARYNLPGCEWYQITELDMYTRRVDSNTNGIIDLPDIQVVAQVWGLSSEQAGYAQRFDWDRDGDIDAGDLQQIAGRWRKG